MKQRVEPEQLMDKVSLQLLNGNVDTSQPASSQKTTKESAQLRHSVALCQSTRLSPLQPGFNPWAGMWESSLLSLRMSGGFPSGFLPPPERFKISSYKPIRVGRVLDLHSGDVKHTFIYFIFIFVFAVVKRQCRHLAASIFTKNN